MKYVFDKNIIYVLVVTIIVAFLDISGLPSIVLFNVSIFDINPLFISLFINFIIIAGFIFLSKYLLFPSWDFAFNKEFLLKGIKEYGAVTVAIFIITTVAFYIGLKPYNYNPSVYKVLFEGIIYYIGVGFIEELYIRGLLLNALEINFKKRDNSTLLAIVSSSVIFGLGHIFGAIGSPLLVIVSKVIWTISLGLFLGVIYKKSNSLYLAIFAHCLIDFSAIAFVYKE